MHPRIGIRKFALATTLAVIGAGLVSVPAATAAVHDVKITEVQTESSTSVHSEYVELEMLGPNENNFMTYGAELDFYAANGTLDTTVGINATNPVAGTNRKVLIASTTADAELTLPQDYSFSDSDNLASAGGAVCFDAPLFQAAPIDCVSYGSFNNTTANLPVGTAASAPATNQSLHRTTARGCPTLTDGADDTNDSLADFASAARSPIGNAAGAQGTPCFTLTITRNGTGTGSVTGDAGPGPPEVNIACPATACSYQVPSGYQVSLTATPTPGSTFVDDSWVGCVGLGNTCLTTMDSTKNIAVTFSGPAAPPGGGTPPTPPPTATQPTGLRAAALKKCAKVKNKTKKKKCKKRARALPV